MTGDPIDLARETLDRALRNCEYFDANQTGSAHVFQQEAATYLLELKRFVACIEGNANLRRCAEDAVTEKNRRFEPLAKRDAEVQRDLVALRRAAQERFPLLAENADRSLLAKPFATWTLATFDNIAGGDVPRVGFADEFEDASPTGLMVKALSTALFGFLPEKGVSDSDPNLRHLKRDFRDLRRRRTEIHQEELNLQRGDAGAIWQQLRSDVLTMNPPWDSFEAHWLDGTDGKGVGKDTSRMHGLLYGRGPVDSKDRAWFAGYRAKRNRDLKSLNLDFHLRLGMRASVGWILQRYARRCRRLRLEELSNRHGGRQPSTKTRELDLARDAATFLFDQGFEVLVEQAMGSHRYDIIGEPLLVEAKIYDGKRRGLAAVVEGLSQIHQYANDLADEGVHGDPVLLVFRLGGPRATPVPEYKIGNLRVTIAHVDLGGSADSGSKAPSPEPDITEQAITDALERRQAKARLTPRRSSPRA
jgi:hypothetical protein